MIRRLGRTAFVRQRATKRSLKDIIKPFALYTSALAILISAIALNYDDPTQSQAAVQNVADPAGAPQIEAPLLNSEVSIDKKLATDIAADFALQTNMPIAPNVSNLSISLSKEKEIAQTDDRVISKPEIVQPSADVRTILNYKAKSGDTVQMVAERYGVSVQTIKWANNLTSDALEDGRDLIIPPTDGVVYTVKEGDTPQSIAEKYKGSAERIVTYNDLEVEGLKPGLRIVVPNGELPEDQRPGYVAPRGRRAGVSANARNTGGYDAGSVSGAYASRMRASAGNAYAFGNCTWYAFERRKQLGRPIGSFWGNGADWARSGAAAGFAVNKRPAPGAIMQNGGGYGHVAIVETVNPDGSIVVSEMNYAGFNTVSNRTVPAGQIGRYNFIH